ncbi:MAG: hypothetical protein AAF716_10265 [Cyanobacteria bacterium P01_D01_bin.1]
MANEIRSAIIFLLEKDYLLFIVLGILLLTLFSTQAVTIGACPIEIAERGKIVLGLLGFGLLTFGTVQYIRASNAPHNVSRELSESTYETRLIKQREEIKSLRHVLLDVKEIATRERNHTSDQILEALSRMHFATWEYSESLNSSVIVVQWVEARIPKWLSQLSRNDFKVTKKGETLAKFKEDINDLLGLLCENLRRGVYATPKSASIKLRIAYLISYRKTLLKIRSEIVAELDRQEFPDLGESMRGELIACLNELIESIQL